MFDRMAPIEADLIEYARINGHGPESLEALYPDGPPANFTLVTSSENHIPGYYSGDPHYRRRFEYFSGDLINNDAGFLQFYYYDFMEKLVCTWTLDKRVWGCRSAMASLRRIPAATGPPSPKPHAPRPQ
jgi:hypothetical protein